MKWPTFSSCWKELGCCDLSIFLEVWAGVPKDCGGLEGERKDFGETIVEGDFKGRAAGSLSLRRSMLVRKEPRAEWRFCPTAYWLTYNGLLVYLADPQALREVKSHPIAISCFIRRISLI